MPENKVKLTIYIKYSITLVINYICTALCPVNHLDFYLFTNFWRKILSNGGLGNWITDEIKSVNAIVKVAIDKQETRNDLLRLM